MDRNAWELTLVMKLLFFSKQFKYDRFEQIRTLRPNVTIPGAELCPRFLELTGSAYPKVRWSARRALRSRGDTGCFERGLVSRRAREAEKRDGEVRFSVRPCLPELGMGLPSFHSRPPSLFVEYPGPNA